MKQVCRGSYESVDLRRGVRGNASGRMHLVQQDLAGSNPVPCSSLTIAQALVCSYWWLVSEYPCFLFPPTGRLAPAFKRCPLYHPILCPRQPLEVPHYTPVYCSPSYLRHALWWLFYSNQCQDPQRDGVQRHDPCNLHDDRACRTDLNNCRRWRRRGVRWARGGRPAPCRGERGNPGAG